MFISSLGQGLLWAPLVIGVFITFRILDIPDLTTEGSFPLGAATTISLMIHGQSTLIATIAGFVVGCVAGIVTGVLDTKLKIPSLLAGILTMTGLYSVNMHIMGKSNVPLLDQKVLTSYLPESLSSDIQTIIIGLIIVAIILGLLYSMFKTRLGLSLMATGNNKSMSAANGIQTDRMIIFGYMISNGLIALSGSLIAQSNGYADIGMGIGTIVIGLASVLVGEIFFRGRKILVRLLAMVFGAIIYRLLLTIAMGLGFPPDDLKILSAVILIIVICVPIVQNRIKTKKQLKEYLSELSKGETYGQSEEIRNIGSKKFTKGILSGNRE
ncbi:ABC transporter permease [Companilactobacillus allii]|uniref:ABC transporter permease n=1 Tax=Companilactobacillus allii TaxID=1847728 RepID=A0A1P8Q5Q0_9LACO|nr:ABC transporter permease [Companilactobacillus allii]APX73194.1 ABC transporter permease [Companilactobacillus allii]USQ68001.1 ABC transporter permease [Companilactobacillus allii]